MNHCFMSQTVLEMCLTGNVYLVWWEQLVSEHRVELLYHVVASEEGVDGVQVVVKELRHAVDDVKGDGLENTHHLHVFPCGITGNPA